jgi:REP element-mobilizing transposase RayT
MVLPRTEELRYSYIRQKCREKKAFVYALNGMPDHVHLGCSMPAALAISDFAKAVKGSGSHFVSHYPRADAVRWQRGYSYHTFAKRDLSAITAYVENQKQRHADGRLWPALEHLPSETAPRPGLEDADLQSRSRYAVMPKAYFDAE